MHRSAQSDEELVEKARRVVIARRKLRWGVLLWAVGFLGFSGYLTIVGIGKIESLGAEQLREGFVYGLALAILWTSFGVLGAICLGKFLVGLQSDFRLQELLVRYHDHLRDLGHLHDDKSGTPGDGRSRHTQ